MKKRRLILFCMASILLMSLVGCSEIGEGEQNQAIIYEQTEKVVEELNENSNLYMDMLSFVDQHEWMGNITPESIRAVLRDEPPLGGFDIRNESNEIRLGHGLFDLYPHDTDDIRLTQLIWTVPDSFHVFGIDVGGDAEVAETILIQHGYEEREAPPHFQSEVYIQRHNRRMVVFAKDFVSVAFFVVADGSEILEVLVTVTDPFKGQPTNERGVEGVDWVN